MAQLRTGGLVLYKGRPACIRQMGADRLEVETDAHQTRRVRPKDVVLLHPGPCALGDLTAPEALETADAVRELLVDEPAVSLDTLAELLYGVATPAAVWAAWGWVEDGLHFDGTPEAVRARSADEVAAEDDRRRQAEARAAAWDACLERVRAGTFDAADADVLRDVEGLAEGRREGARLLKALGRAETPENAHALLLRIGWWSVARLPYMARAGVADGAPQVGLAEPAAEERRDLTHLRALAIDDEGNRDPDDAIAVDDEGCVWVHVADVAAWVAPDSAADLEARARGATLYLPHGAVPMLPPELVPRLGLGLAADGVGPALSFRLRFDDDSVVTDVEVVATTVRVERLSYEAAEPRLDDDPDLQRLAAVAGAARARRLAAGAVDLEWPEVRIRVDAAGDEPVVDIAPLAPLRSRQLVAEVMILAGAGAAVWAQARQLAFPFSVQDASAEEGPPAPPGLPAAYALRRRQQPARVSVSPAPHRGLGLQAYGRATSPLRRYVDLLAHQQLRTVATGAPAPFDESALLERAAAAEPAGAAVRAVERQANRHWTLVWLSQRDWRGRGVLVDTRGRRGLLVLPEIGLEAWMNVGEGAVVGTTYEVTVRSVDLPRLDLHAELTPVPA